MFFEFSELDIPNPKWGTLGAPKRYQIVAATASLSPEPQNISTRIDVLISLTVKPLAVGNYIRLAQALGGIIEDSLGAADGQAFGLRIAPATTNKATSPTGYYTSVWTAAANIVRSENRDKRFTLPEQSSSYKLTARAGTSNTHYMSINAGNTNTHSFWAIVARDDGAAVTSADCQIYYNAALTTTFTSLGNGWYLAEATAAGINAATNTGLLIASGRTVYQIYFSMEETSLRTPMCYGAMMGCAWTGATYGSTSTRTAGRVRVPVDASTFGLGMGAIAITWKTDFANTAANDRFFFSFGSTSIRAYYQSSDDTIYFTDNTNTINTAAQTFSAGDVIRLIFIWGPSGVAIYKNGVSAASGATYTPPAAPSYCYIGTNDSAASHLSGIILGFTIYETQPTAAQIAAIDQYSSAAASAGKRVDFIPYLWTQDGDDVLDNCNDSTRDNWCTVGGVPGNVAAQSSIEVYMSSGLNINYRIWMFSDFQPYYYSPNNYSLTPIAGTSTADANSEGGAYHLYDGSATWTSIDSAQPFYVQDRYVVMMRVRSSAGTLACTILDYGGAALTLDASTTVLGLLYGGEYSPLPTYDRMLDAGPLYKRTTYLHRIYLSNGTTTAGSLYIDYIKVLPRPALMVYSASSQTYLLINGENFMTSTSGTGFSVSPSHELSGDVIEVRPGGLTNLMVLQGFKGISTITDTARIELRLAPRWRLL